MRILLIEDSVAMRANLTEQLENAGHEVDVAVDGRSGLLLALAGNHDVPAAHGRTRSVPQASRAARLWTAGADADCA